MTNITFKAGDKVYFPRQDNKIYTLDCRESVDYPLFIDELTTSVTIDGKYSTGDQNSSIFHATDENYQLLSQLYKTEFEKPKKVLKGSDLTRHFLSEGKWVVCYISDEDDQAAMEYLLSSLITQIDDDGNFVESDGTLWSYAVPIQIIESIHKPLEIEL